jgi:predicted PurR-regulated permease PerM
MRAIAVVFALALVIVMGLAASVVPQLVVQSQELAKKSSELTTQLPAKAAELAANPPKWLPRQGAELAQISQGLVHAANSNAPIAIVTMESSTNAPVLLPGEESDSLQFGRKLFHQAAAPNSANGCAR